MKTENLSMALDALTALSSKGAKSETIVAAQQELSELQRLVDVVKGFIEDSNECNAWYHKEKLCNIVGYKE